MGVTGTFPSPWRFRHHLENSITITITNWQNLSKRPEKKLTPPTTIYYYCYYHHYYYYYYRSKTLLCFDGKENQADAIKRHAWSQLGGNIALSWENSAPGRKPFGGQYCLSRKLWPRQWIAWFSVRQWSGPIQSTHFEIRYTILGIFVLNISVAHGMVGETCKTTSVCSSVVVSVVGIFSQYRWNFAQSFGVRKIRSSSFWSNLIIFLPILPYFVDPAIHFKWKGAYEYHSKDAHVWLWHLIAPEILYYQIILSKGLRARY